MSSIARRRFYIDPELQLPLIAALTLLATAEALFVGFGFYKAIAISYDWQRPHQALDFFGTLVLVIVPTLAFNLAVGVLLSHRIAGPADKIRRAMGEIAHGNLDVRVSLRRGDFLQAWAAGFNVMAASLRESLRRRRRSRPRQPAPDSRRSPRPTQTQRPPATR